MRVRMLLLCWLLLAVIGAVVCADILREPLPERGDLECIEAEYANLTPVLKKNRKHEAISFFEIRLEDGAVCRVNHGVGNGEEWLAMFTESVEVGDRLTFLAVRDGERFEVYEISANGRVLLAYEDALADARSSRNAALVVWGAVVPLFLPAVWALSRVYDRCKRRKRR